MFTTRCWGVTAALSCALLFQNCRSHSLRASSASSDEPSHALSPEGPRVCVSKVEGVLRAMPGEEEDSRLPAQRRYSTLASEDDLPDEGVLAWEGAEPDEAKKEAQDICLFSVKTPERAAGKHCVEQGKQSGDPLTILLDVASSKPDKAIQFLDVLLVAAQDEHCRQQALEALGKVAQASPGMFSACLPSLRAAAKEGDKDVRLLASKTLGEVEWRHYFGEVGPVPDLPSDMAAILDSACPFWSGKKVKETHLLVLIPATVDRKPFTLNLLEELIQCPKNGGHKTQYSCYDSDVQQQFGASSPAASYWLLMTRDVLPGSRDRTYAAQKELVAAYARCTGLPYKLPKALEAATAILTHHVRDGERLYGDSPWTYTRCRELIRSPFGADPAVVGGFEPSGLTVYDDDDFDDCLSGSGAAGCRRLDRCVRRDVLTILLDMASSQPDKAIQFLDVLLVAAQDEDCRQQALEALGKVTQASPGMLSACFPSLRAAAKEEDENVRLSALKMLGEVEWKHYSGETGPAPDLPSDMAAILDSACSFWPGKKVKETHLLVLIPAKVNGQPFSLNLLCELIQHPNNGGHKTQYCYCGRRVQAQLGADAPTASYWLLMTRDILPESRSRGYRDQEKMIAAHASRTGLPYELPKALEAATAILMHHVRDGERLYGDTPWTYTRCQEWGFNQFNEYPAVVGCFGSSLNVSHYYYDGCNSSSFGVASCRRVF
jgi:hypothetical protein